MQFIFNVIVFLHFVGLASLLGGFIVQMKSPEKGVNPAMLHGALTQLITGVLMVGILESNLLADEDPPNMMKIGTKLVVVLIITVLAFMGRKKTPPQVGLWATIGALTLLNVAIAVFWN